MSAPPPAIKASTTVRRGSSRTSPDMRGARRRKRVAQMVRHAVIITFIAWILAPLGWVFLLSIKSMPDAYRNSIWPQNGFDFSHYAHVLSQVDLLPLNMVNSIILTVSAVVITTASATLAGYALVHLRTPGKFIVIALMIGALFFPVRVTGLIGIWEITRALDLLNTRIGLIPPYVSLGLALGVLIMRTVFAGIPKELVQAARVDGAGPWASFRHVALPLAWNGVVVTAMLTFILAWGEYLFALTLITDRELQTLPVTLASAIGGTGQWAWPRIAAVYVMAIIPALLLFAFVQKRFMRGMEEGAMKG